MINQPGSFKKCPSCGQSAALDAAFCSGCGHQYRTQFPSNQTQFFSTPPYSQYAPGYGRPYPPQIGTIFVTPGTHSPFVAVMLSLFCCSVGGQFYNRQYIKGVITLVCGMVFSVFTGGVGLVVFYPVVVIDAACVAGKLNRGEPVGEWTFF